MSDSVIKLSIAIAAAHNLAISLFWSDHSIYRTNKLWTKSIGNFWHISACFMLFEAWLQFRTDSLLFCQEQTFWNIADIVKTFRKTSLINNKGWWKVFQTYWIWKQEVKDVICIFSKLSVFQISLLGSR